jgi:SnoaL-like domain
MGMTVEQRLQILEDIQAITELKASYCNAADGGWDRPSHDADKVASLFVEGGVWDAGEIGRGEGREAIRALFNGFKRFPFAFHRVSNPVIKVQGDTATNIGLARLFPRAYPALGPPIRAYLPQITTSGGSKSELVSRLCSKHGPLLRESGRQGCSSENSGEERPGNEQPYSNPSR